MNANNSQFATAALVRQAFDGRHPEPETVARTLRRSGLLGTPIPAILETNLPSRRNPRTAERKTMQT